MNITKEQINDLSVHKAGDEKPDKVVILLHGRGGTGQDIIELARHFFHEKNLYLAPTAHNNRWYPESFMKPTPVNQPSLTQSLKKLDTLIRKYFPKVGYTKIHLIGFSQGACLSLQYGYEHPRKYGGIYALSGGLIGRKLPEANGDLQQTNVFLGCGDTDPYIPKQRVHETATVLSQMKATVEKRLYDGMGHTVNQDELDYLNQNIVP